MKGKNSILFIIPYFGKWPEWMELYVDSLRRNSSVNFLFITDCDITVFEGIENIQVEQCRFEEYIERFKKVLGKDIQVPNPYKICDLRPFFGLIHEKDIAEYDFFGWTDVDLFFGDLRFFYTDQILANYDVISTHENRLSGHCALLRNNEYHRQIGFKIYDWKAALQNPEFVGIDEHGITNALQMTLFDRIAEKLKFSKNNGLLNLLRRNKTRKHYFVEQYTTPFTPIPWIDNSLNSKQPEEWYYHRGKVGNNRDSGRSFIYIHLMNFKSSTWRADKTSAPWEKSFKFEIQSTEDFVVIDSKGIIAKQE